MEELYDELPADLACWVTQVSQLELHCLECENDEWWSFVGFKANKQWVWLALDRRTPQIVAFHVAYRSAASALALWQAIPQNYRQKAKVYSHDWDAYKTVIPPAQHQFSKQKKETGQPLPITLSGSFAHCASGRLDWSDSVCHSPKNCNDTSKQSKSLSPTTTSHYLLSTTHYSLFQMISKYRFNSQSVTALAYCRHSHSRVRTK